MLDIDSLRLTKEDNLAAFKQFGHTASFELQLRHETKAIADAQLKKALSGIADWLEEYPGPRSHIIIRELLAQREGQCSI